MDAGTTHVLSRVPCNASIDVRVPVEATNRCEAPVNSGREAALKPVIPMPSTTEEPLRSARCVSNLEWARRCLPTDTPWIMEDVDTVVLGVKNQTELTQCLEAEALGSLPPDLRARIDGLGLTNA